MNRRFGFSGFVGAIVLLLFNCSSCTQSRNSEPPVDLTKPLTIKSDITGLRATETSWDTNDKIGLYVLKSGRPLASGNIYSGVDNHAYTTENGDGIFTPVGHEEVILTPSERVDVLAYYPHQEVGADYALNIDVSDQSNLPAIDLLYSDNAKGLSAQHSVANLNFTHQLSQIQVTVQAENGVDLTGLKVTIGEVFTKATFNLAAGKITTLSDQKSTLVMHHDSDNKNSVVRRAILLPGQSLKDLVYTFQLGGKSITYTDNASTTTLAPNRKERKLFLLDKDAVKLLNSSIEIIGEGEEGGKTPGTPEQPGNDDPQETPLVSNTAIEIPQKPALPTIVEIKALANEVWSATTDASFVRLENANGTGAGLLKITLEENTSTSPRTATVTVTGKRSTTSQNERVRTATITITQKGKASSSAFSNQAYYMEQVLIKSGFMEDVLIQQHNAPDQWFSGGYTTPGGGGKRRNYTIYFSKNQVQPYMIAYPLYKHCMNSSGGNRTNKWDYDPEIAVQYQPNLNKSYRNGYSRGHMLSSASRTATRDLNITTFYYTNMVPQNQKQNGGVWGQLEGEEREWVKNAVDTLFVVCGPLFQHDQGTVRDGAGQKKIPVPSDTWKVFLKKERGSYKSIGTIMPNTSSCGAWKGYAVTVQELENKLGVKFFPQLPEEIATSVKSQKNTSDW